MTERRARALLHLTVFIWSFTAILGKWITINPLALIFYRQAVAAALILLGLGPRKLWCRGVPTLLLIGAAVAGHWLLFFYSIKLSGVAVSVVCLSTGSIFGSLLGPLLLRKPLRLLDVAAGTLVIGGVITLMRVDLVCPIYNLSIGVGCSFLSALFATFNGHLVERYTAAQLSFWELAGGAGWSALVLAFLPRYWVSPLAMSHSDLLALFLLSFVCTVFPWLWSMQILKRLTPFAVLLAVNLEPVYSLMLAYVLFPDSERLHASFYRGALMIGAVIIAHGLLSAGPPTSGTSRP
jgi:drug/metabolite transporter (DMT)-like permease